MRHDDGVRRDSGDPSLHTSHPYTGELLRLQAEVGVFYPDFLLYLKSGNFDWSKSPGLWLWLTTNGVMVQGSLRACPPRLLLPRLYQLHPPSPYWHG